MGTCVERWHAGKGRDQLISGVIENPADGAVNQWEALCVSCAGKSWGGEPKEGIA